MIGKRIGRYKVVRELGKGAMGHVWEGVEIETGQHAALKVMNLPEGHSAAGRRVLLERFRREAEALQKIDNPYVVKVYAAGEIEMRPYIAMELLSGQSLREELELGGPLALEEAERVVVQVCRALHAVHEHGIVHRDVKPDNIMLLKGREHVKLADFGVAKSLEDATLTATGSTLGTPAYMSPEQVRGWDLDGRSDIFSTGVILYELTTRRRPFRGDSMAQVTHRIVTEDPMIDVKLPRYLTDIIAKALKKDPDQRYQTALEMAEDLEARRSPFAALRTMTSAGDSAAGRAKAGEPASHQTTTALTEEDDVLQELATRLDQPSDSNSLLQDLIAMAVSATVAGVLGTVLASIAGALASPDEANWRTLVAVMGTGVHLLSFFVGLVMPRILAKRGYEPDWTGKLLSILGFSGALAASALCILGLPPEQFGPLIGTTAVVGLVGIFIGSAFASV